MVQGLSLIHIYGTDNDKYLGRYGMLRNNWYELNVGNVYGPGYPGVPPVDPNQPDDELSLIHI